MGDFISCFNDFCYYYIYRQKKAYKIFIKKGEKMSNRKRLGLIIMVLIAVLSIGIITTGCGSKNEEKEKVDKTKKTEEKVESNTVETYVEE